MPTRFRAKGSGAQLQGAVDEVEHDLDGEQ